MNTTGQLPITKTPRLGSTAPPIRLSQHQGLVPATKARQPTLRGLQWLSYTVEITANTLILFRMIFLISLLKSSFNNLLLKIHQPCF